MIQKTLPFLRRISFYVSVILMAYILGTYLLRYTIGNLNLIKFDPRIFDHSYLRFLTTLALGTGVIGIIIGKILGEKDPTTFSSLSRYEKFTILVSSVFFSIFFIGIIQPTAIIQQILFVLYVIFFSYITPRLIGFYTSKSFWTPYIFKPRLIRINTLTILYTFIAAGILIFASLTILNISSMYLTGKVTEEAKHKEQLYIKEILPKKTTHAETVTLIGYNFGWKTTEAYKIMGDDNEIPPHEWTNERIQFIVPLSLKEGTNHIWIRRPKEPTNPLIVKSNIVNLAIVDRFEFYPAETDNKFQRGIKKIKRYIFNNLRFLNFFF